MLSLGGRVAMNALGQAPLSAVRPMLLGVQWVHPVSGVYNFPTTAAAQTTMRTTVDVQFCSSSAFGTAIGWDGGGGTITSPTPPVENASTPYEQYSNLAQFDARWQAMKNMQGPGGKLGLILISAPRWMLNDPNPGYAKWTGYTVDDARLGDWARFASWMVGRYQPDYLVVWNELKGYWNSTLNRWDWERYSAMYKQVWDRVKADHPSVLIGGPYVNCVTSTGTTTTKTLAQFGARESAPQGGTGAQSWYMSSKLLDAFLGFRQQGTQLGFDTDFVTFDAGIHNKYEPGSTTAIVQDEDKLVQLGAFLQRHFPGKPLFCMESYAATVPRYPGDPNVNWPLYFSKANEGGFGCVTCWHEEPGQADVLVNANGSRTVTGQIYADYLANRALTS